MYQLLVLCHLLGSNGGRGHTQSLKMRVSEHTELGLQKAVILLLRSDISLSLCLSLLVWLLKIIYRLAINVLSIAYRMAVISIHSEGNQNSLHSDSWDPWIKVKDSDFGEFDDALYSAEARAGHAVSGLPGLPGKSHSSLSYSVMLCPKHKQHRFGWTQCSFKTYLD